MQHLSDEALRDWIVETRPEWQEAYHLLLHERYGGVVLSAVQKAEARYGRTLRWEEVLERLFFQLRGRQGEWTNLRSWAAGKGSFSAWLWVVTHNVCRRMLRASASAVAKAPLEELETAAPTHLAVAPQTLDDTLSLDTLVQRLEPLCAQLLRLKYYHGLKDSEIGQQLGFTREWANRRRRQCVQRLNRLLRAEGLSPSDFHM